MTFLFNLDCTFGLEGELQYSQKEKEPNYWAFFVSLVPILLQKVQYMYNEAVPTYYLVREVFTPKNE